MITSVVVPVYNSASTVSLTLAALQRQDFAGEFEILAVDNGSTDGSLPLLRQFGGRVRVLDEPQRGSYAARNRGLREAKGDILAFTDADRIVCPGWLQAIHDTFASTDAQVLIGKSRPFQDNGLAALLADYENAKAAYITQLANSRQAIAYTGNMAVRRKTWDRYGPFLKLQRGADTVFARRVADDEPHGAIRYCPEMVDVHIELADAASYYRKVYTYGKSIRIYSQVNAAQPLTMDDRSRIVLRTAQQNDYGPAKTALLGAGLAFGWLAYTAGFWRGAAGRDPGLDRAAALPTVAPTAPARPGGRVSVIVEWENVLLAGQARGAEALRRVAREVAAQPDPDRVEVLVVYAPEEVDGGPLADLVARTFRPGQARILAGSGAGYYELKNVGVEAATGDIVVFSDSDTHVEEGWLKALLEPFAEPTTAAVAGNSYLEPATFLSRAFALFWFFPLRSNGGRPEAAKSIFANNVAVRRPIFRRIPFHPAEGTDRGACILWREKMLAAGLTVLHNPNARTAHPPPNGGRHFFVRALTHGRDALLLARGQGRRLEGGVCGTLLRLSMNCLRTTLNAWTRREGTGLRWWETVPAMLTGYVYYGVYFAGEVMTFFWPGWMSRRFRI